MSNSRRDPFEIQLKNDLLGLSLINRWGWMRPTELGLYLWPKSKDEGRKQACAQCAKWLERGLVLQRKLPQRVGYCYVLAKAGVDFLKENGREAVTGKDIGRGSGEDWLPPIDWKHQLLTVGVVARLDATHEKDKALSDLSIKRLNIPLYKIPDALCNAKLDGVDCTLFIETENARKTKAKDIENFIRTFQDVARGHLTISGFNPHFVAIVFDKDNKINHRLRMSNFLKSKLDIPVTVLWFECTTKMHSVTYISIEKEIIQPDEITAFFRQLKKIDWKKNAVTGKLVGSLNGLELIRWTHVDGSIQIKISDERYHYYGQTITEATQKMAERLVERQQEIRKYGHVTEGNVPIPEQDDD
jgi:hypothetical protein